MLRSVLVLSFTVVSSLAPLAASAGAPTPPAKGEEVYPTMAWPEIEAAVKAGATLVDARSAEQYAAGHIPGAINVPTDDDAAMTRLPADKTALLVFYCGGPACNARTKCATKVQALGHTKLAQYKGGYPEWRAAHPN